MTKLTARVLAFLLTLCVAAPAAPAAATKTRERDIAATHAYLLAKHRLEVAASSHFDASEAALGALVAHVRTDCPNAMAGAPATGKVVDSIREEIYAEVPLLFGHPIVKATIRFANDVKRLHWSNRKLTYYAHGGAAEEKAHAGIVLPDLCADVKAVVANGFQAVPPATASFVKQYEAANDLTTIVGKPGEQEGDLEDQIMKLLKPYELPSEKSLIPKKLSAKQREKQELLGLQLLFKPMDEIAQALELPKPPSDAPVTVTPPASAAP